MYGVPFIHKTKQGNLKMRNIQMLGLSEIKIRLLIFVGYFLVLISNESRAEPPESFKYLINEPASLFDIGMMRMHISNKEEWIPRLIENIQGENLTQGDLSLPVYYNGGDNKIRITAGFYGDPTEKKCERVLNEYKNIIVPFGRKLVSGVPETRYIQLVRGFYSADRDHSSQVLPKDFGIDLGKSVLVSVLIFGETPSVSPGKVINCSSGFESDVTSFR